MLNYKIKQIDEEWSVFNDRVVRMSVDYQIEIYIPKWLDFNHFLSTPSYEWLDEYRIGTYRNEPNYDIIVFRKKVSSISKCNISLDDFDEEFGVHMCETRAEIKILEFVKRIMNFLYKTIGEALEEGESNIDKLNTRLGKNIYNQERLRGVDLEED